MPLDTVRMEARRRELGLSQQQAADRANLSGGRSHWNDIVNGRRANITMETLDRIADALGVNPSELVAKR
jgi:transcriptional regulator with XRE-family HTH domain